MFDAHDRHVPQDSSVESILRDIGRKNARDGHGDGVFEEAGVGGLVGGVGVGWEGRARGRHGGGMGGAIGQCIESWEIDQGR